MLDRPPRTHKPVKLDVYRETPEERERKAALAAKKSQAKKNNLSQTTPQNKRGRKRHQEAASPENDEQQQLGQLDPGHVDDRNVDIKPRVVREDDDIQVVLVKYRKPEERGQRSSFEWSQFDEKAPSPVVPNLETVVKQEPIFEFPEAQVKVERTLNIVKLAGRPDDYAKWSADDMAEWAALILNKNDPMVQKTVKIIRDHCLNGRHMKKILCPLKRKEMVTLLEIPYGHAEDIHDHIEKMENEMIRDEQ